MIGLGHLLGALCVAGVFGGLPSEEDLLLSTGLFVNFVPETASAQRAGGFHFRVAAHSGSGKPIHVPDGVLCFDVNQAALQPPPALRSGHTICLEDLDQWFMNNPDSDGMTMDASRFPDGYVPFRATLYPQSAGFVQPDRPGRPASTFVHSHGRVDRLAPLHSPVYNVSYFQTCRRGHCDTVPLDRIPVSDNPLVATLISKAVCEATFCDDHATFIAALADVRARFHPAVVGPNAAWLSGRRTLPVMPARTDLPVALESDGGMRIGVEVGVQAGHNLERVLSNWPTAWTVFAVDPWTKLENYNDIASLSAEGHNANMEQTRSLVSRFGAKARLVQDFSTTAAALFPDGMLDFVYLDARHDYASVKEDLEAWWPKIRRGGIMAGHDFLDGAEAERAMAGNWAVMNNGTLHPQGKAVKGAVMEFVEAHNVPLSVAYHDSNFPSFAIRKL